MADSLAGACDLIPILQESVLLPAGRSAACTQIFCCLQEDLLLLFGMIRC
jgi:hypothetical protein